MQVQQTPSRMKTKSCTPKHIIIKLFKDKEKIERKGYSSHAELR